MRAAIWRWEEFPDGSVILTEDGDPTLPLCFGSHERENAESVWAALQQEVLENGLDATFVRGVA